MNWRTLLEQYQELGTKLTPVFLVLLFFFTPLSTTVKSVFFVLSLVSIVLNPYYNQYIFQAINTFWGRSALLVVAFAALACLWSPAPLNMQMSVLGKYSKLMYLPLLAVGFIDKSTRFWCMHAFLAAMVVTVYAAIFKGLGLIHLGGVADLGDLFSNHIITGVMMSLACYWAGLYAFQSVGKTRLMYWLIAGLASCYVFFLNTGRSGYVVYVLLVGLLLLQKCTIKKTIIGMCFLVASIGFIYLISPELQEKIHLFIEESRTLHQNPSSSLALRMQFHQYAFSLLERYPWIGVGTGGFQYIFQQRHICLYGWGDVLNEPHSQYWFTLAEQGVVGGLLLLTFICSLFRAAFKLQEDRALLLGFLVVFWVQASCDTILCYSPLGHLLLLVCALCFGNFFKTHAESSPPH